MARTFQTGGMPCSKSQRYESLHSADWSQYDDMCGIRKFRIELGETQLQQEVRLYPTVYMNPWKASIYG